MSTSTNENANDWLSKLMLLRIELISRCALCDGVRHFTQTRRNEMRLSFGSLYCRWPCLHNNNWMTLHGASPSANSSSCSRPLRIAANSIFCVCHWNGRRGKFSNCFFFSVRSRCGQRTALQRVMCIRARTLPSIWNRSGEKNFHYLINVSHVTHFVCRLLFIFVSFAHSTTRECFRIRQSAQSHRRRKKGEKISFVFRRLQYIVIMALHFNFVGID